MGGYAIAASGEQRGGDGIRQPAGEVHAWQPGRNETACGLALSRTALRRFPHERWEYSSTDVLTDTDAVGWICPKCLSAAGGARRGFRPWTRVNPRP
jgi:hypothetical protein